tara:strand:- start:714 stop:2822 length:2109 start_codon:yes stop_codon:yes gene_type:complete
MSTVSAAKAVCIAVCIALTIYCLSFVHRAVIPNPQHLAGSAMAVPRAHATLMPAPRVRQGCAKDAPDLRCASFCVNVSVRRTAQTDLARQPNCNLPSRAERHQQPEDEVHATIPFDCRPFGWDYSISYHVSSRKPPSHCPINRCGYGFDKRWLDVTAGRDDAPIYVDVGANMGQSLLPFASLGWRVLAFEPVAKNARLLQWQVARNCLAGKLSLFQAAASNRSGRAFITVPRGMEDNSALPAAGVAVNPMAASFAKSKNVTFEQLQIAMQTVDEAFNADPDLQPTDLRLAKIDVQGHEVEVLQGMRGVLRQAPHEIELTLEYDLRLQAAAGHSPGELPALAREMGFETRVAGQMMWLRRPLCQTRWIVAKYDCPRQAGNQLFPVLNAQLIAWALGGTLVRTQALLHRHSRLGGCDTYLEWLPTASMTIEEVKLMCPNATIERWTPPTRAGPQAEHFRTSPTVSLLKHGAITDVGDLVAPNILDAFALNPHLSQHARTTLQTLLRKGVLAAYGRAFKSLFSFPVAYANSLRAQLSRSHKQRVVGVHVRHQSVSQQWWGAIENATLYAANLAARQQDCVVVVSTELSTRLRTLREGMSRCALLNVPQPAGADLYDGTQFSDHGNQSGTFMQELFFLGQVDVLFTTAGSTGGALAASQVAHAGRKVHLCSIDGCVEATAAKAVPYYPFDNDHEQWRRFKSSCPCA